jgi:hypothetical protein
LKLEPPYGGSYKWQDGVLGVPIFFEQIRDGGDAIPTDRYVGSYIYNSFTNLLPWGDTPGELEVQTPAMAESKSR